MLDNLMTSLNVVLPLCLMLICGFLLRKSGYIDSGFISKTNKIIFRLFLPASLFRSCYTSDLNVGENIRLIVFCCLAILTMFLLFIPISKRLDSSNPRRSVILQASFRGNIAMFGVPVLTLLYKGENLGIMAVLLAFMIPELNILAVLCFDIFSLKKTDLKQVLLKIAKNPLICSILLGILFNVLKLDLPGTLDTAVEKIAAVATPLSFVMLGAGFSFRAARSNIKPLSVMLTGKLIIFPAIAMIAGILLGLKGPALASAITLFGSPVAVSSVPMADELGGDLQLAGDAVVISTVISVLTMFVWIFLMSALNLL